MPINKAVDGKDKSLRELLSGAQYSIDYYQRSYKWEQKQIVELVDDLTSRFLQYYQPTHTRREIGNYPSYFLGSIILSKKDSTAYIVDGQQRLTSITLLLIYLRNLQKEANATEDPNLAPMILSTQYGESNFNIRVDEREKAISALYKGSQLPPLDDFDPVKNVVDRYFDIAETFPDECKGEVLPFFIDWLIERVQFVEIAAYSDDDAYTIFETMNDRGLSLTPSEMLKGYILSEIKEDKARNEALIVWNEALNQIAVLGRDAENDFFRTWFRGRFAVSVGVRSDDFERIGPEFHRWLRDNATIVGLDHPEKFQTFALDDLPFYARWYSVIRQAGKGELAEYPHIHYIVSAETSLDLPMILISSLNRSDSEETIKAKLVLTSRFLDVFINRRFWGGRNLTNSALKGTFVRWCRAMRFMSLEELAAYQVVELDAFHPGDFDKAPPLLTSSNRSRTHRLLARFTSLVQEEAADGKPTYGDLIVKSGPNKFQIEHIWANKFDRHKDEFDNEPEFQQWRNRLGDLVLLPATFNASYGDLPWKEKLDLYKRPGHPLLPATMSDDVFKNNPRLRQWIEKTGFDFPVYGNGKTFNRMAIEERTDLYRNMAKFIWNSENLLDENLVNVDHVLQLVSDRKASSKGEIQQENDKTKL